MDRFLFAQLGRVDITFVARIDRKLIIKFYVFWGFSRQSPRHHGTRGRQDNDPTVSVDMVDGVNESVISATERIVIQQQSNNLKVFRFCHLSICVSYCPFFPERRRVFLSADPISPPPLLLPLYNAPIHTAGRKEGRQNGRRL